MDSKIFLGKYRVDADEMEAVGEITDNPRAYEGEEIDSGKKVVVEMVAAGALKTVVRERLEAEAAAAKKLTHVNIPALYDFGIEDNQLVYVTEDFEGTLAEEWVNAHGPMPVGPVLRIAAQVVSALGAAAFHRINHHAINPNNLVLVPGQTAEGEWPLVKVLHFVGVAPKFSGPGVAVAAFDKSLHYASPEQIQTGTVDFRSEIYSLGCTMWFLLTGAPPLTTPSGPMAEPLTQTGLAQTGLALDKIGDLPKTVRRLLAQMLSVNPEARPCDPLAFYRQLQDSLAQVEGRETRSRKFGVPVISNSRSVDRPRRRRSAMKALALAAVFLALAALAVLVLPEYLRHRRVVQGTEPIGKPIGVPEASASATPFIANTNAIASDTAPPTTAMADSTTVQSAPPAPPTDAESPAANVPSVSTDRVVMASSVQAAVTPAPPAVSNPPKDPPSQEPAPVAANKASALPAATDSREVASSKPAEQTSGESPPAEIGPLAQQTESEKIAMREVRRAEPADDEPEVRRAEPAPPEEGPKSVEAEIAASNSELLAKKTEPPAKPTRQAETKTQPAPPQEGPADAAPETPPAFPQQTNSLAQTEESRDVDAEPVETTTKRTDSRPIVPAKSPAKKAERAAKPKRQPASDRARPRSQQRTGRARLVGVTPEGWWMLELPSNKIIIVPPPPSSR